MTHQLTHPLTQPQTPPSKPPSNPPNSSCLSQLGELSEGMSAEESQILCEQGNNLHHPSHPHPTPTPISLTHSHSPILTLIFLLFLLYTILHLISYISFLTSHSLHIMFHIHKFTTPSLSHPLYTLVSHPLLSPPLPHSGR